MYAAWCSAVQPWTLACAGSAPAVSSRPTDRGSPWAVAIPRRWLPLVPRADTTPGDAVITSASTSGRRFSIAWKASTNGSSGSTTGAAGDRMAAQLGKPWARASAVRAPSRVGGASQRASHATADGVPSWTDANSPAARSSKWSAPSRYARSRPSSVPIGGNLSRPPPAARVPAPAAGVRPWHRPPRKAAMALSAVVVNCTLKPSPAESNTEALAAVVVEALEEKGVAVEVHRALDFDIRPGVTSDEGDGDEWPRLRERIAAADILVIATPTWLGQPSSVAKRVLERMDAMISETDDEGRPIAYGKVGGVVVTGNEDGAHHVIAEVAQSLIDIGFTVPGQAWTYWNMGPGPGPSYLESTHKHEWSRATGRTAAANLHAVAEALGAHPLPVPESA